MGLFSKIKEIANSGVVKAIQGVLDVAGFIPVVGTVADLANTAIYVAQGNYKEAALSALSAIPAVGDGIAALNKGTKLVKMGKKMSKAVDLFKDGKKLITGKFNELIEQGMKASKKVFEVGGTLTKKLDPRKTLSNIKEKMKSICLFGNCFTEDTLVHTEKGYVKIRDIRVGDLVYSMNEETGEIGLKRVEETSTSSVHTIFEIEIGKKEKIKATKYHPFYVEDKGWVNAINLVIGDKLIDAHDAVEITAIEKIRYEEPIIVYNFHVEDWVSFFISQLDVYVHNGNGHIHEVGSGFKNGMKSKRGPKVKSGTKIKGGLNTKEVSVADNIPRLDEIEVKFNYNSKYDKVEFSKQLADQQKGMNDLTVDEYLKNRQKYLKQGRSSQGNAAQQATRENAYLDKVKELRESGVSAEKAKKQAQKWIDNQAALHNPDQVAGGYALNVGGVGDKGINSSIGAQWRSRISDLDGKIRKMAKDMTDAQKKSTYLNIKLKY